MNDFNTAKKQFTENLGFLGPNGAKTDPEKFNLYAGLANLADGVASLASRVEAIERSLRGRP
jgi:hypothetical protein